MRPSNKTQIDRAIKILEESKHAVALTGAGISTPSGIPDFRTPTSGIWERFDPFRVATISAFMRRPQDFFEWMHPLAKLIYEAEPNPAHLALVDLERYGPLQAVITQNIDMLHHKAGSKRVYEVHGHLRAATCMDCGRETADDHILEIFVRTAQIPYCKHCEGILKPNVTLFGETPPLQILFAAEYLADTCDLMLVAGSSLEVLPVADFPRLARGNGARLIIVNSTGTYIDRLADVVIRDDVAEVLPQLVAPFLSNRPLV